jgi:hypothetical protein
MNVVQKVWIVISLFSFLFLSTVAFGFSKASAQSASGNEICTVGDVTSKTVMSAVKDYNCSIVVLLGDYYGKESTFVSGFIQKGVPVLAACGNHDDCTDVGKSDNIKGDSVNYGFRWKGVAFLILNTEESINSQKAKAEGLLNKWQNDNNITSIVVAQHKASITTQTAHHKESEAKDYRGFFVAMAEKYPKLDLLLSGHNHGYQVCKPETPNVLVITDGTGGRTPYPWGSARDDNCDTNLSGSKYNGFSVISMQPDGEIKYKHINANN